MSTTSIFSSPAITYQQHGSRAPRSSAHETSKLTDCPEVDFEGSTCGHPSVFSTFSCSCRYASTRALVLQVLAQHHQSHRVSRWHTHFLISSLLGPSAFERGTAERTPSRFHLTDLASQPAPLGHHPYPELVAKTPGNPDQDVSFLLPVFAL